MAPQKGKQATKGAKQIVEDNKSTLKFYKTMTLGSSALAVLANLVFFEITTVAVIMNIVALLLLIGAYQFMIFMARASYTETGALSDSGTDLNIDGGVAENVKDLIIVTSATLLLALLSNYFWLLLLAVPVRVVWMLWSAVIKPWLAQRNAAVEPEVDEKKQRKMERKMRRMR